MKIVMSGTKRDKDNMSVANNQCFHHTLLTFWPDFNRFYVLCWHSQNVDVDPFWGGGGGEGLIKCMFCTLVIMLTIMDDPLEIYFINVVIHDKECVMWCAFSSIVINA